MSGWIWLLLGAVAFVVFYIVQSNHKQRRFEEFNRNASQAVAEYSRHVTDRLQGVVGVQEAIAICSAHSSLLRPSLCLLTVLPASLRVVTLNLRATPDMLDELDSHGIESFTTKLTFEIPFSSILEITKKRPTVYRGLAEPTNDKLKRAVVGGVIAGPAGAMVGALTGGTPDTDPSVVSAGDTGGIFDDMKIESQTVLRLACEEFLIVDGSDMDLDHVSKAKASPLFDGLAVGDWDGSWLEVGIVSFPCRPWMESVDIFMAALEETIVKVRMDGV